MLIVDQVDLNKDELTPELRNFIIYLATNSRNFRKDQILFLMSNPEVLAILSLNGRFSNSSKRIQVGLKLLQTTVAQQASQLSKG